MHSSIWTLFHACLVLNLIMFSYANDNATSITCGDKVEAEDADGRRWEPDFDYITSDEKTQMARAQIQDPSLPSKVPYMTARIIYEETTYRFSINSSSRYFLRLHFYPAVYGSLNISESYFSVTAGSFTLLNNFSAAITAKALSQSYIVKEYSLAPMDGRGSLDIIFKASDKPNSFAFINGIELVPMPNLLDFAALVGFSDQNVDAESATLETMFRLNVGGNYISPSKDSGLLRTWYDDMPYILGGGIGVTASDNETNGVDYKDLPIYTAPEDVYLTWRSMGPSPNVTLAFNLTWLFSVDPSFTYIMRLHFCEHIYSKVNQRFFNIFINNQTATPSGADVIAWAGAKDVPVYKDFAVAIPKDTNKRDIKLELHPRDTDDPKPQYYDAILNGLELFKVGDENKNLAGPNPTPSEELTKAEENRKNFKPVDKPNIKVIGTASGVAAAFGALAVVVVLMYKKKTKMLRTKSGTSSWLPVYGNSHTSGMKSTIGGSIVASAQLSTEAAANCRHFSLGEIRKATKNFDESYVIGVGGFGKVYRGVIDGSFKVAIKRSNPSSEQGVNEFVTEIEMLSKLRHKHLVSLIGYCEEDGEMALVYDYMARGTLREHLYKGNKTIMPWKQRLNIMIGSAKGLHYLHTGAKYTIIHRDVKTTNILLDDNWVAKVSDFGLSKTGPDMNQTHVSTVVKGSFGYLDPEYFRRQQLTEKSDVYSFGVVLFETLCSRPALNPSLPKEQVSLADWAMHSIRKGNLEEIIDPAIKGEIKPECLKKYVETAVKCLSDHGVDRPTMSDLLWNLEFALQLQENGDAQKVTSNGKGIPSNVSMHLSTLELDDEDLIGPSNSTDDNSNTAIFSQIVRPTGR